MTFYFKNNFIIFSVATRRSAKPGGFFLFFLRQFLREGKCHFYLELEGD